MKFKHVNAATAHYNLGLALFKTYKTAEKSKAVALLTKDSKILRRVAADDESRLVQYYKP